MMKYRTHRERGFIGTSLAEMALVIMLGGLIIATVGYGIMHYTIEKNIDQRAVMVGEYLALVGKATDEYITKYSHELLAFDEFEMKVELKKIDPITGLLIPYTVKVKNRFMPTIEEFGGKGLTAKSSEAKNFDFLPSTFPSELQYGDQKIAIKIKIDKHPKNCFPAPGTNCHLDVMVYTDKSLFLPNDNTKLDERRAVLAANAASPGNAGVSFEYFKDSGIGVNDGPRQLRGKGGEIIAPNPLSPPLPGIVGLRVVGYETDQVFLRLDGSTALTGNLKMGYNDIENIKDINGIEKITASGTAITISSDLRLDNEKKIIGGGGVSGKDKKTQFELSENYIKILGKCFKPEELLRYEKTVAKDQDIPLVGNAICTTTQSGISCRVDTSNLFARINSEHDKDYYYGTHNEKISDDYTVTYLPGPNGKDPRHVLSEVACKEN